MGEWQPIETAPKDGSRVLTYSLGLVGTGRYITKFGSYSDRMFWYSDQLDRSYEPTHWQPLPEPPK